jgi:CBS domain-containing protein
MSIDRPRKHVSHPILRLEVLGPDGRRQSEYRVYCRERRAVVPIGVCCACVHCESIAAEPPAVQCLVTASRAERPSDPRGVATPVGEMLTAEAVAVDADTTLREALAYLRAGDRRSVPVVDQARVVVGILHDAPRAEPPDTLAADAMGSRLVLPVTTPIRRALALMAAAHLREIVVVDEGDVPLGTFRDVDGLHWLALARKA